jgi:glyoxylase-like metal-dependent hydrolase (beta-lactamase superfamily II)
MEVQRLAEGLWRWTAPHPEWKPGDDWEQDVGCVYVETPEAVVLIDPLVPAGEERETFWEALDRDVDRFARPVVVLLTCEWHVRSAAEVAERYGASRPGPGETLPEAIEPFAVPSVEETLYLIPEQCALVSGDLLIGEGGTVRLMPESWMEGRTTPEDLRATLRPLLDRDLERILVSHGAPALERGREALAAALGHAHTS